MISLPTEHFSVASEHPAPVIVVAVSPGGRWIAMLTGSLPASTGSSPRLPTVMASLPPPSVGSLVGITSEPMCHHGPAADATDAETSKASTVVHVATTVSTILRKDAPGMLILDSLYCAIHRFGVHDLPGAPH